MKAPVILCLLLIAFAGGCRTARFDNVGGDSVTFDFVGEQDPKWGPYGPYLKRAIARVQAQWERELMESRILPPAGVTVTVVFWISFEGRVSRIENVKSEPDGAGVKACLSAITRAGTFGPWPEEMKRLLGLEQKLTFTFHYEDTPNKKPSQAPRSSVMQDDK